jgi:hypothetical protein
MAAMRRKDSSLSKLRDRLEPDLQRNEGADEEGPSKVKVFGK